MRQCFLCQRSDLNILRVVKRTPIYECPHCKLGVTSKVTGSKKKLYKSTKYYSATAATRNIDKYIAKYERIIERLNMYITGGKVLDVGGGFGLFASLLSKNKSYKVTVLEPNLKPLLLSNKTKVKWLRKDLQNYRGKRRSYSIITFLDVLEHFKNPLAALHKARELLKIDGFVVLLVPNYKSSMRYLSRNWPWWMVEDHYYHYSRSSIKKILAQTGFKLKYMETFESVKDFWLSLQSNYSFIKIAILRKVVKTFALTLIISTYLLLRPLLWRLYNGGLLLVIAQKK